MNGARFFLPSELKEAFPQWRPAQIGGCFAVVALVKIVAAPWVARHTEGASGKRARVVRGAFLGSAVTLLVAGGGMLLERSAQPTPLACVLLLLVVVADIATQSVVPLFWAMHHATQPAADAACSIALVNAIGNLGGFIGPSLLGALHDNAPLAARVCAPPRGLEPGGGRCFAQWGAGTAAIGLVLLATTAIRLWKERRAGGGGAGLGGGATLGATTAEESRIYATTVRA